MQEDVPLLYWTAAAWGLAISASKNDPDLIADFPLVFAMASRAIDLDETINDGALHELFITLEASRPGGDLKAARGHYARALELSGGRRAGTFVTLAESVCVKQQNSREFHQLIDRALGVDLDASPRDRLVNILMQKKARWLKSMSEDLFLDDVGAADTSTVSGGDV